MKYSIVVRKLLISICALALLSAHAMAQPPQLDQINIHPLLKEIEVTGSSFGPAPNVVFFDNFEKENLFSDTLSRLTKPWFDFVVTHKESSGNIAHRAKDPVKAALGQLSRTQIVVDFGKPYTEAFVAFSVKVPKGSTFAGAETPKTFPPVSSWKFTWLMSGPRGLQDMDKFDVCLPSHTGKGSFFLGGNSGKLSYIDNGESWWQWDDYNHMTSYIKIDPDQPTQNPIDYSWSVVNQRGIRERAGEAPASNFAGTDYSFDRIHIPGWWGNGDNSKFDGLYDNIYIAVGENSLARAVLTDNAIFSKSSFSITIPPKSWSGSRITFDMDAIPHDNVYFLHLYDNKGNRSAKALRVCLRCPKMP